MTAASRKIRVATAQFRTGKDTDRVLRGMLTLIDEAAANDARLVHFQECCNYPTSYDDREHAWNAAITIPGPMFDALAAKAREHRIYVSFNAAVRGPFPKAWMTNHLVGPDGQRIGGNSKQILMWIEREAFSPAEREGEVYDTELGRIGLLSCMDGLIPETARVLAVKGADIILNSLCSNGLDEAHTHIPARAAENGVFVIAANRIGDMVQGADLQRLIDAAGMDREKVKGAGESQIVGPEGEVLARATRDGFGLVYADIDLGRVARPQRLAHRRPECYGLLTVPNESLAALWKGRPEAGTVTITALAPTTAGGFAATLAATREALRTAPRGLVVLPELFAWNLPLPASARLATEVADATSMLEAAARERGDWIAAGLPGVGPRGVGNRALLFGPSGRVGEYGQVHVDPALGFAPGGDDFPVFDLPFGRVGLLLGGDLFHPEAARVLARTGVDLIACPSTWRAAWQTRLMLVERAAENHVAIAAAARADSPLAAGSIVASTPNRYVFGDTGEVNIPEQWHATGPGATLSVEVDLRGNRDKRLMGATNVILDNRPELYGVLAGASPA